jgi:hypothetical protein
MWGLKNIDRHYFLLLSLRFDLTDRFDLIYVFRPFLEQFFTIYVIP